MSFKYPDSEINDRLNRGEFKYEIKRTLFKNKIIRFVTTKSEKKKPALIFIHGAPGSLLDFESLLLDSVLNEKFQIVSIDRLGYGESDYGRAEYSIIEQALAFDKVLKEINSDKFIFVGWSYGGPIALELSRIFKGNLKGVIMIGPAIAKHRERYTSLAKIGTWIPFRWLLSGAMKSASYEKINHQKALEEVSTHWNQLKVPIIHVHGKKDKIVPYFPNVNYGFKLFNKTFYKLDSLESSGHFIHFKHKNRIINHLLLLLSQ